MSFEQDITGVISVLEAVDLNEGYAKAKELYVKSKPPQMSTRTLNSLAEKDPTPQKKYIEWMAKNWVEHRFSSRNMHLYDIVKEFDDLAKKNKIQQKDINRYENLTELTDVVHQAQMQIGEESRLEKEQTVKQALNKFSGSAERAYKYLNNRHFIDPSVPEYATKEFVEDIRQKMADAAEGKAWKNFTIDEDILEKIDPADVTLETPFAYIVEVKSKKKSQFYGRNMWYDPATREGRSSFWCTSYTAETNLWDNYAFYSGQYSQDPEEAAAAKPNAWRSSSHSRFYIILPKDISYVPDKKWAKVNVQVEPGDKPRVWDTDDRQHSSTDPEVVKLFKSWKIPWKSGAAE